MEQHHHRPTIKQTNKSYKRAGGHATKSSLKDAAKGRTQRPGKEERSHVKSSQQNKASRKNKAKQVQLKKQAALRASTSILSGHAGEKRAPRVVAVLCLCEDVDPQQVLASLMQEGSEDTSRQMGAIFQADMKGPKSTSFQYLTPAHGDLLANVDAIMAADHVLLCLSSSTEVDAWGENMLRTITALGIPESGVRALVTSLPEDENHSVHTAIRKSLLSFSQHFFPTITRIYSLDVPSELSNLTRSMSEGVPRGVGWREERARLLAEGIEWEDSPAEDEKATLKITGYVRGACLSADRLVHLQGLGDFQLAKIEAAPVASTSKRPANGMDAEPTSNILGEPTEDDQDDLQSTNVPDDEELLLNEQTWPTEEDMQSAPGYNADHTVIPSALPGTTPKRLKRVPQGTSNYQAAWILDEGEDEDSVEEEDDAMSAQAQIEEEDDNMQESNRAVSFAVDTESTAPHHELDPETEQAEYAAYKTRRALESRDDADFPDEVDTPQDMPARERFARFRGLKSFRTSPWDPYEQLPRAYARCFMFENWKGMSRRVVKRAQEDGVQPGTRVIIYIKDVPKAAASHLMAPSHPVVVYALHKHEHKYTVMHFSLQRNTEFEEDVRSKDDAVLLLGPRRFAINPIFSSHAQGNHGKGANNVHKFLRFFRPLATTTSIVASCYLPATFGTNVPALLIKPDSHELIGSGTMMSSDPTRVLAKRFILTGHPFKLHKRTATIRYMFFNSEDVDYFKPVQLKTKKGRTGHIRESLGTHGYFKAGFDGPMNQMDTVCLNLYKRIFPKFGTVLRELPGTEEAADIEMD